MNETVTRTWDVECKVCFVLLVHNIYLLRINETHLLLLWAELQCSPPTECPPSHLHCLEQAPVAAGHAGCGGCQRPGHHLPWAQTRRGSCCFSPDSPATPLCPDKVAKEAFWKADCKSSLWMVKWTHREECTKCLLQGDLVKHNCPCRKAHSLLPSCIETVTDGALIN